jgi:amino acid transporter
MTEQHEHHAPRAGDKGLKQDAIGFLDGLVIGISSTAPAYWGWESAVNLNEETEDSDSAPGLAAVFLTVILLGTYVITTIAVVSYAGLDRIAEFEDDAGIFGALATDVLGSPLDKLVVLAIITSALSSTQTTILPASRTTLSMARQDAFPAAFGKVHPRYMTPHVSTIVIGAVAAVWFGVLFPLSENFVYDSLTALSLMIAFYYALTGIACAIYYRRELTKSVKIWRAGGHRAFFGRKLEIVDPDVAAGHKVGIAAVAEEAV